MAFSVPSDISNRPTAVIGAGTLGRRIALMLADRGGLVRIYDPSEEAAHAGAQYAREQLPGLVETIDGGAVGTVEATADQKQALNNVWLVVEAVPERLDLKRKVFGELDREAPADAILASNSSSYPTRMFIDEVQHPERVVNLHFYMPPGAPAADVMANEHTDRAVIDLLLKELPSFGIYPFEAHKESTGFIFNRIWAAIKRESLQVVAEGVSTPQDIDAMWRLNLHTKAGPFQAMDQVGLDVVLDIEKHYEQENPNLSNAPVELLQTYVDSGNLGVKTGRGFYDYGNASNADN